MCHWPLPVLILSLAINHAAAAPQFESVRPSFSGELEARGGRFFRRPEIGLYEKFELSISLNAAFENPYDPEDIDLTAEFTAPSGKMWNIWGFYSATDWSTHWMVRFSPTEVGTWKYVLNARDGDGQTVSREREFEVVPSGHHGFVRIAPNKRYLQYSDGTSYYGVGLWYNDGYGTFGGGQIREQSLDELRRLGANFISFFASPLETPGTGLGRYDQNRAGRLDEIFTWCETRNLHISWNLIFHSYISESVWGGGNARYRFSPYRSIATAQEWFGSDDVWKYQQQLYRYIIARWGYSRSLFLWFIVDEINGTEGWTEGDTEVAENWCRRMNDFIHEHDPYGRPTTGTQSGGFGQWWPEGYRIFDIAGREIYEAQGFPMPEGGKPDLLNRHPLRDSYRNYATQTEKLWNEFDKPAIIAECGFDHTYYEPGMPGYLAMYHNALWAALANGACATPFWWSYSPYINDTVVTSQIRTFSQFVRDIDFASHDWQPCEVEMSTGDGWAMRSDDAVFGWVANPMSGVAQESFVISDLSHSNYSVRLYRTWRGQYLDPQTVHVVDGKLQVKIPELVAVDGRGQHIGDDVAFLLVPQPASVRGGRAAESGRR